MDRAAVRVRHVARGAVNPGETMSGSDVLRRPERAVRCTRATVTPTANRSVSPSDLGTKFIR